jgi:DNA-directed RNA polymerase specialized sigma24 family protein
MASGNFNSEPIFACSGRFATTCWSVVVAAQDVNAPSAKLALASLCQAYWYPLYSFIRRQGHAAADAEDLTQGFFSQLVEKDLLGQVDRSKGKFRSFLLAACTHFLANQRDHARAWKRGGRSNAIALDLAAAEARFSKEMSNSRTPERLFARRWGLTLLETVLDRLREDYAAKGKGLLFETLRICLLGEKGKACSESMAAELGMTAGALRVAVHRLRQQFREVLREEIGRTVDGPDQIEEEIRDLFAALGPE